MIHATPLPEMSRSRYDGALPEGLTAHVRAHVEEYGLPVEDTATGLRVTYAMGVVTLDVTSAGFAVEIAASSPDQLYNLRESVIYLLDHVAPEASGAMRWTGVGAEGRRPPNFHLATVLEVRRVSANFLRIELACDGIAALSVGGMHFSLLIPPAGRTPRWPELNDKGRTVWPKEADVLHRAPYTFVTLDAAAGRFSFDVYEHAGGGTTLWARAAMPGAQVGIMGPGGGDLPPGDHLVMAGDETALPAIRRILALSPADRRGHVFVELGDPADICEMPRPAGMALTWVTRGQGATLWDHLEAAPLEPDTFVWVAAEQALGRRAKAHFRTRGVTAARSYLTGYWVA
ncbi:siderophore-interacting protein [Pseudooceanicola sp. LIPI14-2-Ac024]|uniref:siderophore-interacting protein n=1 Tax=Pseudooceanicola sp. LIPI14-2-Ac024 TaxID=3344875 RepID=UPI0035D07D63